MNLEILNVLKLSLQLYISKADVTSNMPSPQMLYSWNRNLLKSTPIKQ